MDAPVMLTWGELVGRLERQGKAMSILDSLIAATALRHDFKLVTRNVSDFAHSGVEIVNPWD
jgi:predicted nucleic acid-binding protein